LIKKIKESEDLDIKGNNEENAFSFVMDNDMFKDVRANCFCASLMRTQIHATSSMSARALNIKINK